MFNFENKRKMKKIVLVCIVAIMATAAQAQIYVGGTLGFSSVKTENSDAELKTTTIKLLPEIGYELDENWSIGTVVGYQYSKTGDLKTNTFTIAPYARYSFLQSDLIKLFVDGGFGFSTAKVKGSDAANSWNIGLKPGLAIKLSDRFCLVAKYGFLGYSQDETPMGTKTKNFGLDLDTDELNFGFHYIF
jgi:long-subunit fatty acid transport protein